MNTLLSRPESVAAMLDERAQLDPGWIDVVEDFLRAQLDPTSGQLDPDYTAQLDPSSGQLDPTTGQLDPSTKAQLDPNYATAQILPDWKVQVLPDQKVQIMPDQKVQLDPGDKAQLDPTV